MKRLKARFYFMAWFITGNEKYNDLFHEFDKLDTLKGGFISMSTIMLFVCAVNLAFSIANKNMDGASGWACVILVMLNNLSEKKAESNNP